MSICVSLTVMHPPRISVEDVRPVTSTVRLCSRPRPTNRHGTQNPDTAATWSRTSAVVQDQLVDGSDKFGAYTKKH